jgi:hypothetical protein
LLRSLVQPATKLGALRRHSNLTTERYDHQRLEALPAAVERLKGGKRFDAKMDASDNLSAVVVSTGSAKAEAQESFTHMFTATRPSFRLKVFARIW